MLARALCTNSCEWLACQMTDLRKCLGGMGKAGKSVWDGKNIVELREMVWGKVLALKYAVVLSYENIQSVESAYGADDVPNDGESEGAEAEVHLGAEEGGDHRGDGESDETYISPEDVPRLAGIEDGGGSGALSNCSGEQLSGGAEDKVISKPRVCMHVSVCACVRAHVLDVKGVSARVRMCSCTSVRSCVFMRAGGRACACTCAHARARVHVCVRARVHVCTCRVWACRV